MSKKVGIAVILVMRQVRAVLLVSALTLRAADTTPAMRGYSESGATSELQWEKKFRAIPQQDRLRENMRRLSARPHHVGSPYEKDNAEWILAQLKSWGLAAKTDTCATLV